MSKSTTNILATAAGVPLCDVVVVGVLPDASLYIAHSGSTIASLIMHLELAKREALKAWDEASEAHNAAVALRGRPFSFLQRNAIGKL
jgi:hypothetical protein